MTIQHRLITDAERHEPKGASTATIGQVAKANGDGTTTFVNPATLVNVGLASTIESQNFTTQNPSGTDAPMLVVWGSATSDANVSIATDGTITFLTAGLYFVTFNLNFGRSTTTAIATLLARLLVNDVAVGFTQATKIDTSANITPFNASVLRNFSVNDTLKVQVIRDSAGQNDGGLVIIDPVLAGWATSPSAAIRIQKILGA